VLIDVVLVLYQLVLEFLRDENALLKRLVVRYPCISRCSRR